MRRMDGGVMGGLVNRVANSMTSFDEIAVAVPASQFDLKSIYPLSVIRDIVATASSGAVILLAARSTSGTATVSSVFRAREEW